jgi:hypothetical protein
VKSGLAISLGYGWRRMRPPGRGDFWILKIAHAASPKSLSKNGFCLLKGGSLSGGNRLCKKKFSGGGRVPLSALAPARRAAAATGRGSARADGIGHSARFRLPASRPVTSPPRRFRTIQVRPKDLPARRW